MKLIRVSSSWCVSCIITKKAWDELKEIYDCIEYDYDMDEELLKNYNVGNILPVIIIEEDNQEIDRIIGEKSKKEILEIINNIGVKI